MWTVLTFILGTAAFLIYLLKMHFAKSANFWAKKGVFTLKNDLSIIELLTGKKSPPDFDKSYYKQLGSEKFGGTMELGSPLLFVKDLDVVKNTMIKDFDHFADRRDFIDTDPLFSKSLFFLHGQEWKDMRSFLSPTFTSGKIRRMFHHFEDSSQQLLKYVKKYHTKVNGAFTVLVPDLMGRFTTNVIGATAFGMETDSLTNIDSVFYKMTKRSSNLTVKRLAKFGLFTMYPKVGNFFNMQSQDSDVSDFFYDILKQALRSRENLSQQREDFLQLLIEAKRAQLVNNDDKGEKPKVQLTEELAISQAFLFFMAGFDTTANLLGESIYMLAVNPEMQEQLFTEVEGIMNASDGKIPYESTNKMEYMDMFIAEILRMYPAICRLERKCIKDYKIPDTEIIIPKGTVVGIPAECIHWDEKHYPEPEKFNPDRFSAKNKASRNPYTILPFGIGPRNCIGMRLGLIEAKVALAYILHNFEIQPLPGKTPIPVKMWINFGVTRVPYDLEVRFVPRK